MLIFFHSQDDKYLDGGLIANNPTTDAIIDMFEHAEHKNKKLKLKVVLSLGCGLETPKPIDDIDFEPSTAGDTISHIIENLACTSLEKRLRNTFLF